MRPFVEFLQSYYRGRALAGVEIGVYEGENALEMLTNLNIQKLYLIDPWVNYPGYDQMQLGSIKANSGLSVVYDRALSKLSAFKDKSEFVRQKSSDAAPQIPEVDFVYIDGNHVYEYIKQDIALYYPKVKGVLGGDNLECRDVAQAVGEFICESKQELYKQNYKYYQEWWVIKHGIRI